MDNYLLQENDFEILLENGSGSFLLEWSSAEKSYLYKIYTSAGVFITTWTDVVTPLNIKYDINGALSPLTIRLARPETGYGENDDVKQGNRIKIYVFDKESGTSGVCVYSGLLVSYVPTVEGSEEYVDVVFYSHYWDLNNKILLSGNDTEVTYNSYDPSDIMKDLLDRYSSLTGSILDYSTSTIETTGTSVSYTFNTDTYQSAVKKVIELCPDGWYYRVEPDDLLYLKAEEVTPSHKFTIGKDIMSYTPEKKFDGIINTVYFRGGDTGGGVYLYKKYTNSSSVTAYGTRATVLVDQRVTTTATAQIMADRVLNEKSSPEIRVVIKILDSNNENSLGYDIESIKVGQTCNILNATSKGYNLWDEVFWDIDAWDFNITNAAGQSLQIMSIDYYPNYAVLELSNKQPDIAKRIEDIDKNWKDNITVDNPATPT